MTFNYNGVNPVNLQTGFGPPNVVGYTVLSNVLLTSHQTRIINISSSLTLNVQCFFSGASAITFHAEQSKINAIRIA